MNTPMIMQQMAAMQDQEFVQKLMQPLVSEHTLTSASKAPVVNYPILTSRPKQASCEVTLPEMIGVFGVQRAIKIAYIPLVIAEVGLNFALQVCHQCAAMRLPHVKKTRSVRECAKHYLTDIVGTECNALIESLRNQTDQFYEHHAYNYTTLWYVINMEVMKRYPKLSGDYTAMLTNLYMSLAMLGFSKFYDQECAKEIREKLKKSYWVSEDKNLLEVRKQLTAIAEGYDVPLDTMLISRGIKIIGIAADSMIVEVDGKEADHEP